MNPSPDAAEDAANAAAKKAPPRMALLFATALGLGYLPLAPGTWGSLAGVALAYSLSSQRVVDVAFHGTYFVLSLVHLWLLVVCFVSLLGVWAAGRAARHLATHDPQIVVIDEVSGQLLALLLGGGAFTSAVNWKYYVLGFILFRVFDIWKPFPVNRAESLPGGWGIMADDWVAGLYAAGGLWVVTG